ncbi:hypothetical protein ACJX0J_041288, partial [Zea mays]
ILLPVDLNSGDYLFLIILLLDIIVKLSLCSPSQIAAARKRMKSLWFSLSNFYNIWLVTCENLDTNFWNMIFLLSSLQNMIWFHIKCELNPNITSATQTVICIDEINLKRFS